MLAKENSAFDAPPGFQALHLRSSLPELEQDRRKASTRDTWAQTRAEGAATELKSKNPYFALTTRPTVLLSCD